MTNPDRILVTGADGFVGRHLLRILRMAFPSAFLIGCAREPKIEEADLTLPLELLDSSSIAECLAKARADAVIHLAAATVVPESFADPMATWRDHYDIYAAVAARDTAAARSRLDQHYDGIARLLATRKTRTPD